MPPRRELPRLRAGLLSILIALTSVAPTQWAPFGVAVGVFAASDAEARSRSSSSSPSSRSSSSSYSRPSASTSTTTAPRTPSASSYKPAPKASAADKAITRENSARALDSYRQSQEPRREAQSPRTSVPQAGDSRRDAKQGAASSPSSSSSSSSSSWSDASWPDWLGKRPSQGYSAPRRPSADVYAPYRRYDPNWTPPAYAMAGPRQFGMWDAAMLWFMLDTLTRPGRAAFFHNNAENPDLQQWRAEADRMAAAHPDLKTKLATLDAAAAEQAASPRRPGYLPDDVADKIIPPDDADAISANEAEDGDAVLGFIVFAIIAAFLLFGGWFAFTVWRRVFRRPTGKATAPKTAAPQQKPQPPSATGGATVFDMFSGKDSARPPFRVGMAITVDPTPFLLAGDAIKAKQPEASPSGLTNIQGVGVLNSARLALHRLYLTDSDFVQIHLDDDGRPDECRLFHVVDEVDPADESQWAQWLDKRDGMIGWRDFQTPDGKVYERAWSPGPDRIAPVKFHESEDSAKGITLTSYESMLYRAATGLQAPAPEVEYVLVSAVERDGQAWVEIAAGIDVNPASLSLT